MSKKYGIIDKDMPAKLARKHGIHKYLYSGRGNKKVFRTRDDADWYRHKQGLKHGKIKEKILKTNMQLKGFKITKIKRYRNYAKPGRGKYSYEFNVIHPNDNEIPFIVNGDSLKDVNHALRHEVKSIEKLGIKIPKKN